MGNSFTTTPATPGGNWPLLKWEVTTAPTATPVTYAEAKAHLRIEDSLAEEAYVTTLIQAATDFAQDSLATSLMPQTITAVFNAEDLQPAPPTRDSLAYGSPGRGSVIVLPRGPVSSIVSATDHNGTGVSAELERTHTGDRLRLTGSPTFPITIEYTAGYANAAAIPASIKLALLAHVGTLYAHREHVAGKELKTVPGSLADFYRLKSRRSMVA